ncbi:MAG: hypothetical protein ACLRXC_06365 [[Clostridium] leptum]
MLQLGVTMDFSISYCTAMKKKSRAANEEAMVRAICSTFTSITHLNTIAGFLAMCTMSLTLGRDIGIVILRVYFRRCLHHYHFTGVADDL